ncbi:phosphoglycerate dehydrogenase [Natrinema gelatinilyticum]|uniref:phosphoglycerate dehydrogenase n=1 Tax=Natrinema gelatinilyticum TaxID=2961571 RepID=UPI0020C33261|nr:phosphoglycerate dehydrogenase [Natrinema gelatinilyticum]
MSSTGPHTTASESNARNEAPRVLVTDPIDQAGLRRLETAGCDVDVHTDLSNDALRETVSEYDALVVRSGTTLSADVIEASDRLSVIGRAGVGVDNIDIDAVTRQGVLVTNAPTGNTTAVAEHTLALLLSLARDIPTANEALSAGDWEKSSFIGTELSGRTLGVLGFGRIGREVASRAEDLGMEVITHDPYVGEETASAFGATLVDFDDLLERANVISVHVPLTDETYHLLGADEFERLDSDAYLVHPARGGVVDEAALATAVEEGEIAGAAVDVFENEPPAPDNPLLESDDVIVTPHIAAKTDNAMSRVATTIADNVLTALDGDVPESALNAPHTDSIGQTPVELARTLGRLTGELADGAVTAVDVEYQGDIADSDTEPLTATACVGLLDPVLEERVNRVSISRVLEDRDITVTESTTNQSSNFRSMVSLTVETDDGSMRIAGTVTQNDEPYIVRIDGYKVKVRAPDNVIVFYGRDEPGVIGDIGNRLANHDINIAGMYNSRNVVGGETIMVIAVDSPISSELERELHAVENVTDVSAANLT